MLGKIILSVIPETHILVWIYIDVKNKEILSLLPVFRSEFENAQNFPILSVEFFEHEIFFFKGNDLYSSVFTSKGETMLLKVRSLPVLNEFYQVLCLEALHNVTDVYPVKVYSTFDNSFLATCWAFETDENELYFKPVCVDDNEKFDNIDIEQTEYFPVDLGENAIIGGQDYILRYTKETGRYFEKVFRAGRFKPLKKGGKPLKGVILQMPGTAKK